MGFEQLYLSLNAEQRQAVDTIDGPLLVLAGPGTGKTQLLSARVANILKSTDTLPQNILCLTFTESGAENMRERLTRFIGQAAYDVTISTYHGFGSDLIYRFPQYFTATHLQNSVDELGKHEIIRQLLEDLSYSNPLKQLHHHIGDLIGTLSEVKRALLTPDELRSIAKQNKHFIHTATKNCEQALAELSTQSRLSKASIPLFAAIHAELANIHPKKNERFGSLAVTAHEQLTNALEAAQESGKTTTLTSWKNTWLTKDTSNKYVFAGELENDRITALADIFEQYEATLARQGLYDFDDMIARSIHALESHADMKYSLQEQYLYILLDEFQDTNAAQLRLVQLLTDNPVHEGRPNVMAVGDDDQAIYAFQGAQYSNMLDFYHLYRDVSVINLTDNYRSHADIIGSARAVADQIEQRLHHHFSDLSKELRAANQTLPKRATIIRQELLSDTAERVWITNEVERLIKQGTEPRDIAILAPKHRFLEQIVAHLNHRNIPVQYEKRENILDAPLIKQLLTMAELTVALSRNDITRADALWPEVLGYEFWQIPIKQLWQLSWQVYDARSHWSEVLLEHESCQTPALLFLTLATRSQTDTCETMLDYLIGSQTLKTQDPDTTSVTSPLKHYYTSESMLAQQPDVFYQMITELKVLQTKLRDHQSASNRTLQLNDLLLFVSMYRAADEPMLNTSPYHQSANAVQLMTVFKAKGLEFEHVFLPSCHDDVWGSGSRGSTNRLTLPENLQPIRHAGATNDERLRILFVAMTRARIGLYLSSHKTTFAGKATKRLKYLNEQEQDDKSFKARILPEAYQVVKSDDTQQPAVTELELDLHSRPVSPLDDTDLRALLQQRLRTYQLSPTHLNQFIDLVHAGPQAFLLQTLLRFPQAPTVSGQYGNAIHETLEWVQHRIDEQKQLPALDTSLKQFEAFMMAKKLTDHERALQTDRGKRALTAYLAARSNTFKPGDKAEANFAREGVFVGDAHLTGKIDRLEIDAERKEIIIVDYKTGRAHAKWAANELSLHKYRQQLYCYKLLIEGSHTYANYTVAGARLEFIEPTNDGQIISLPLIFDETELEHVTKLIQATWSHIMALDLPDTRSYAKDLKGIIAFEESLTANTV